MRKKSKKIIKSQVSQDNNDEISENYILIY